MSAICRGSSADVLRVQVTEQRSILRRTALRGGFNALQSNDEWKTPTFKLLVFISSTFTDTQEERNFLMDELIFEMRAVGSPHGIQVIFVDMRWGVRDDNSSDHKTWTECSSALNWCKTESMGIFFLSLQADKYGYTPLPKALSQDTMDRHLASTGCTPEQRDLLHKWYHLDCNAEAPEYMLKNLSDHNDPEYWAAFGSMLESLRGLAHDTARYPGLCVGRSVSEWEVRAALCDKPVDRDPESSFFWSHRKFGAASGDKDFCDTASSAVARASYDELISFMEAAIPAAVTQRYCPALTLMHLKHAKEAHGILGMEYLDQFKASMRAALTGSLQLVIEQKKMWSSDGYGLGLKGAQLEEMLHHLHWAHVKCQTFERRENLVAAVISCILCEHRNLSTAVDGTNRDEVALASGLLGVCVCLVGKSGTGKTALMAKVASEVYARDSEDASREGSARPVIIRFCGTSPGSRSARWLVYSICEQIEFLFGLEKRLTNSTGHIEIPYDELVLYFHELLATRAVVLFIDSLDQLSDEDQGRSQLSFLNGVKPHADTRIIVSCLPDEIDPTTLQWLYLYHCETRLMEAKVPRVNVTFDPELEISPPADEPAVSIAIGDQSGVTISVSGLQPEDVLLGGNGPSIDATVSIPLSEDMNQVAAKEALLLLKQLLLRRKRILTDVQWEFVESKLRSEPTALYVNLALDVVAQWSSDLMPAPDDSTGDNPLLASGVHSLIRLRFRNLERDYGYILVRAALGFLTFAASGVSDVEMEDLLSLHDEVLHAVFQYATPKIRRLPSHVWLRLKGALSGMIMEGEHNCLTWYHRQLRETAEKYLESNKLQLQNILALYFSNSLDATVTRDQRITAQNWTLDNKSIFDSTSIVNKRRGREATVHLLATSQWERTEAELCSFEGVCGKIRSGEGFELVRHVCALEIELQQQSAAASNDTHLQFRWRRLQHYMRWLREDIAILANDCLSQFMFSASAQPMTSSVYSEARTFLSNSISVINKGYRMIGGMQLGSRSDFDALLGKLKGHVGAVYVVAYSKSREHLASGGADGVICLWDISSGSMKLRLNGHKASVLCLSFSLDSRILASGSEDCTVRIWDVVGGSLLGSVDSFGDRILAIQFSPINVGEDIRLITTCSDGTLLMWDTITGSTVICTCEVNRSSPYAVAMSLDGEKIFTGTDCGVFYEWDVRTGMLGAAIQAHVQRINSISFSADGAQFISSSNDKSAMIWEYPALTVSLNLTGHAGPVLDGAFLRSGTKILVDDGAYSEVLAVTTSWDRTLRLWNSSGVPLAVLHGHSKGVHSVAVNMMDDLIVSASGDGALHIWDLSFVVPATAAAGSSDSLNNGHTMAIRSVALTADGAFAASVSSDCSVRVWSTTSGDCISVLSGHSKKPITSVAFSVDGLWMVTGSEDCVVRLWKTDYLRYEGPKASVVPEIVNLSGHTKSVTSVAFSINGKLLASASVDRFVRIWTIGSEGNETVVRVVHKHSERINSVAFSPDGNRVITTCDYSVYLLDIASGDEIAKFEGHKWFATSAAFIPCVNPIEVMFPLSLTAISSSDDKSLQIWDISNGSKHNYLMRLMGHTGRVCNLAVSDTGLIASGSWDCTARLWDYTGRELAMLPGHSARVNCVNFSGGHSPAFATEQVGNTAGIAAIPKFLISGSEDGKVRLWVLSLLQLPAVASVTEAAIREQIQRQQKETKVRR